MRGEKTIKRSQTFLYDVRFVGERRPRRDASEGRSVGPPRWDFENDLPMLTELLSGGGGGGGGGLLRKTLLGMTKSERTKGRRPPSVPPKRPHKEITFTVCPFLWLRQNETRVELELILGEKKENSKC